MRLALRLGEICSILLHSVNVMALTATTTKTLQKDVANLLGMNNPVLVSVSPNTCKSNIKYFVAGCSTHEKPLGLLLINSLRCKLSWDVQ